MGASSYMSQHEEIRSLRRQLRIERTAMALLAAVLVVVWAHCRVNNTKSFIMVNGRPVACVSSERTAQDILAEIKTNTRCNPREIGFKEDVVIARAPRDAQPTSRHRAMRTVEKALSPVIPKWAVIANGKPIVALPSRTIAGETLDLAKLRFGKLAKNLAEEPQFKQRVTVDIAPVSPSILCGSAEEAVKFLFDKRRRVSSDEVYVVRKGDLAGSIATRNGLKLAQLWAMNPGMNLNRLQVGDRLRIRTIRDAEPALTVVVRDQSDRTEPIPAPVQRVSSARMYAGKTAELSSGRSGLRRVRLATVYENGRLVGSEILSEEILREPTPRRIAVGIKPR